MKGIQIAIAGAVGALLLAAPATWAQSLPVGVARSKNLVERTVTIDDQTYRVTGETRILDRNGAPLRLEEVVTEREMGDRVVVDQVTYAYDAQGNTLSLLENVVAPR
jgi:hypothetical protein